MSVSALEFQCVLGSRGSIFSRQKEITSPSSENRNPVQAVSGEIGRRGPIQGEGFRSRRGREMGRAKDLLHGDERGEERERRRNKHLLWSVDSIHPIRPPSSRRPIPVSRRPPTPTPEAKHFVEHLPVKAAMADPQPLILVERDPDGVAFVTINRPRSLNSLTRPMIVDLARAFRGLAADGSVRAIVLSGSGRAFCSGVDLTAAEDVFKGDVKDPETDPVAQMERCPKPIIGAVGGFAVTAGFEIALACDILVAAKGAKFIDTHARFGIFPSWGLSQKLARIIGPNKAREVSLTATPLTAEHAERLGFVNHVVEEGQLLKKAREIAEAIIKNNHDLVLRYKSVINDGFKLDLGHALALEKERAHEYYDGMTKEQFKKMQEFIAGRGSKKPAARL
ncbi:hypothetical protein NL676_019078 [Syzygium grande]|nr:hypothetical protein NL676_019078 [Syzygium grande]